MIQIFTAKPMTSNLKIKLAHRLGHIQTDIDWIILICQKSKRPQINDSWSSAWDSIPLFLSGWPDSN